MNVSLVKRSTVCKRLAIGRTLSFEHERVGLLPEPVMINARSAVWGEHEIDAIAAARMAGKNSDEIRQLVRDLTAARKGVSA